MALRAERLAAEQSERLSKEIAAVQAHYEQQHQEAMREMNLFTEGLVREIVRLQAQLEAIAPAGADEAPELLAGHLRLAQIDTTPIDYRDAA